MSGKEAAELPMKAYVQGDWPANPHTPKHNAEMQATYTAFLKRLEQEFGIENTATWHLEAPTAGDAERNFRQLRSADICISRFDREQHPRNHWGSLAMITAAACRGMPCYVLSSKTNAALNHFVIKHERVTVCESEDELFGYLEIERALMPDRKKQGRKGRVAVVCLSNKEEGVSLTQAIQYGTANNTTDGTVEEGDFVPQELLTSLTLAGFTVKQL